MKALLCQRHLLRWAGRREGGPPFTSSTEFQALMQSLDLCGGVCGVLCTPKGLTHHIPCSRAEEVGEKVGGVAKGKAPYLGLEHSSLRQGKVWMVRRRSLFSRRMRSCSKLLISSTCFCSSSTWFCSPSIVSVKLRREEGARMRSQALQVLESCFFPYRESQSMEGASSF